MIDATNRSSSRTCNRDVIENDVEVSGSVGQLLSDEQRDLLTLSDELGGVKFGHHTLQHFVANRGQNSLVEIGAQQLVHLLMGARISNQYC